MLVTGSRAIWLGPVDRIRDRLRRGNWLSPAQLSRGPHWILGDPHLSCSKRPGDASLGTFLWTRIKTPNPNPGPEIAIPERLVEGLGLRPWLGLKLGPRLGSMVGPGVGEEQQTTGQGWLEHRSKARMTGPGTKLVRPVVTEEARGCVSRSRAAEPATRHPATSPPPHPSRPTPGTHPAAKRAVCLAAQWSQGTVGAEWSQSSGWTCWGRVG